MQHKILPFKFKSEASEESEIGSILDQGLLAQGLKVHRSGYWIFAAVGVTWIPLFALVIFQDGARAAEFQLSFLKSISVHIRFLFALPILIALTPVISVQISKVIQHFFQLDIIHEIDRPVIVRAIRQLAQINKSVYPDVALIIFIAFVHFFRPEVWTTEVKAIWRSEIPMMGLWYETVSLPIYQFMVMRWIWSFLCWTYYLSKVASSRLELAIGNPDRMGGLGVLGLGHSFFSLILFAVSSVFASQIAEEFFSGAEADQSFYIEVGTFAALSLLFILIVPMGLFIPKMAKKKKAALLAYGAFCSKYVKLFDRKWIEKTHSGSDEHLLGTSDIQALADLDASVAAVRETRVLPVSRQMLALFALAILIPMFPLLLFVVPPEMIFKIMSKVMM